MKKRNLIIIIASLIFVLLIITSILFLRSDYLTKKIEQRIVPLVENAIGRKLEFSDSRISLSPLTWRLTNVSLLDPKTGETLLKAKDVNISLSLKRLDLNMLVIQDIHFTEPLLSVIRYPDGRTNLEGLFPPVKPIGWIVTVERLNITRGQILYNDQLARRDIGMKEVEGLILPDLMKKEIKGKFSAEGSYDDRKISEQGLKIKGDVAIDIRERKLNAIHVKGLSIVSSRGSSLKADGLISRDGAVDLNGDILLSLKDIAKYIPQEKDLQGKITLSGGVKGSFEDLQIRSDLRGEVLNGRLEGKIEMSYREKTPSYQVSLKMSDLRPHETLTRYIPRLKESLKKEGAISGEIEVRGDGFDEESLEGKGWLTYQDINQKFTLSGEIKKGLGVSIGISGELADIAGYLHIPHFPLHGSATLTGEVSGTIRKPDLRGVVMMPKGVVKEVVFDSVTADLRFSEGTLYLQPVTLRRGDAVYRMNGNIRFRSPGFKDPTFDIAGDVSRGSPKDIVSIFYRTLPLDIKTDGQIKFNGDIQDFLWKAELKSSGGSVYGQTFDSGDILLTLTRERVIFERMTMRREEDTVTGTGWIGFGGESRGEFYADIRSGQFHIENFDLLKKRLPLLTGMGALKIVGSGTFSDPVIEASVKIPRLFVKEVDTGYAEILVSKENGEVRLRGETADMRYNGRILWNREAPLSMTLQITEGRVRPLLTLIRPSIAGDLSMTVSGDVLIEGLLSDPDTLRAKATLSRVAGVYGDYRVENDGDIRLSYEGNRLTFDSVRFKGEGTSLGIIGSLIPYGDTNIFVNGEADLRLLTLLTPEIKYSKGKAFIAFLISGKMGNPAVQGGLAVKDGTIRSVTLKQTLEGANLSVFFNGSEILLESLQGSIGGGTVNGSGKVEIEEFHIKEFGFILEIANALFRYPEGFESRIDGTLIFQGTPKSKGLKGEVRIKRASYEKNLNLRAMVLELQKKRVKIEQPVPFFGNTEINIHIGGKKDIWINNNLAKLPVEVDLILKGTIDHPLLYGRIEAQDGTFVFSRNPFKVISATADFISPDIIRPVLDIHATTEVRGYQIDLRLSGTVDRFTLTLNSDPPLSETDILALLTVGQTASEAAETAKAIGTAEATAFLAAPIQERIESTLQDIIKIDRFQVDPYYSNSTSSGGARLTVGKRLLNERLYVTYTTGITTVEELIKLEYFLGRNVYIIGERDELGRVSGDIKFRFEFR